MYNVTITFVDQVIYFFIFPHISGGGGVNPLAFDPGLNTHKKKISSIIPNARRIFTLASIAYTLT